MATSMICRAGTSSTTTQTRLTTTGTVPLKSLLVPFFGKRHQVNSAMKQDGENRVGLIQSQTAYKVSQNRSRGR
jgi:hypothetical protein